MKFLRTASFLLVVMVAAAAVSMAGNAPIVNMVIAAPTVQAAVAQAEQPSLTPTQQKAFERAYQKTLTDLAVDYFCPSCIPPCPPICPER